MYIGPIPRFDAEAGIEDNAPELYGILGLMPETFLRMYQKFKTSNHKESWNTGVCVNNENVDLVLLLHLLYLLKDRPNFGPATKKKLIRDYCGEAVCASDSTHVLTEYVRPLIAERSVVTFKLTKTDDRGW